MLKFSMLLWMVSVVVFIAAYIAIIFVRVRQYRELIDERNFHGDALIVFAHPDDETMFFTPTLTMLKRLGIKIHFLSLSVGNYDGLGHLREKEFAAVSKKLGVVTYEIIDDEDLPDGPREWNKDAVGRVVSKYLSRNPKIGTIFTFDGYGVSGHLNHISVYRGISLLKHNMKISQTVYYLRSVNILRKYLPPMDFFLAHSQPFPVIFTDDPFLSLCTMKLYRSQNVWYRKLFSFFSRYSYINDYISE